MYIYFVLSAFVCKFFCYIASRDSLLNAINKGSMEGGSNPSWGVTIFLLTIMLRISLRLTETSCSIRTGEFFHRVKCQGAELRDDNSFPSCAGIYGLHASQICMKRFMFPLSKSEAWSFLNGFPTGIRTVQLQNATLERYLLNQMTRHKNIYIIRLNVSLFLNESEVHHLVHKNHACRLYHIRSFNPFIPEQTSLFYFFLYCYHREFSLIQFILHQLMQT
jgi:hypothetical protein